MLNDKSDFAMTNHIFTAKNVAPASKCCITVQKMLADLIKLDSYWSASAENPQIWFRFSSATFFFVYSQVWKVRHLHNRLVLQDGRRFYDLFEKCVSHLDELAESLEKRYELKEVERVYDENKLNANDTDGHLTLETTNDEDDDIAGAGFVLYCLTDWQVTILVSI